MSRQSVTINDRFNLLKTHFMISGKSNFSLKIIRSIWSLLLLTLSLLINSPVFSQADNKILKVNLYGGANPYSNSEWNNWSCKYPSLTSPTLNYTDGTNSGVYARITASDNIGDNGANYGGTMCPPEVLRYASFALGSRTLTIYKLVANAVYNLDFFASRSRTDGQKTIFTIGSTSITITTDYNLSNGAKFSNIQANSNGEISVNISNPSNLTYNYLNGFIVSTSSSSANSFPVVNAGSIQNIYLPINYTKLSGSAYDSDGSIASYLWTKLSGPNCTIVAPSNPTTDITNLELGVYIFRLTALDNQGASNFSDVSVSVTNGPPPAVNAGLDKVINLPQNSVTVIGQASSNAGITSVNWRQLSGPNATSIQKPNENETLISGFTEGIFKFIFSATDSKNISSQDTLNIFVNAQGFEPPKIVDSLNCPTTVKIVVLGSSTASGTGADPYDSAWVNKLRKYLIGKNPNNQVINLGVGGFTTYHSLCPSGFIPPPNRPSPQVNNNITAALNLNPSLIIINLPSNDVANGYSLQEQIDNYERTLALTSARNIPVWVSTSQPRNFTTSQKNQQKALKEWTEMRFGKFAVDFWTTLATADGSLNSTYDYGDGIHLNNKGHHILYQRIVEEQLLDYFCSQTDMTPPVVNAGFDQTIDFPLNYATLVGTAEDQSGIKSLSWTQISGPALATILSPNSNQTTISGLNEGIYIFQFKAADNFNLTSSDEILVSVRPSILNIPPVVSAGTDLSIRLPLNSITVNGKATDQDGTIANINWTKVSGGNATIQNPNSINTTISNFTAGTYIFRLSARDNSGSTTSDELSINILPPLLNSVSAGFDQTIQLPQNQTTLSGTNGNEYGTNSIEWTQLNGPSSVTIQTPGSQSTEITNLIAGSYSFSLAITNLEQNIATDIVTVNVLPIPSPNKSIQVNIYKGLNPFNNSQWNNWNVTNISINSPVFNYTDGSNSGVYARISASDNVGDNGTQYGGEMCPPEVLRYASFNTGSRTLTIYNLSPNSIYQFEMYSSRSRTDGQKTVFAIGNQQISISTDNNKTNAAIFRNIKPNTSGQAVITISKPTGVLYNYLNGFKIIEESILSTQSQNSVNKILLNEQLITNLKTTKEITIFPNPVNDFLHIRLQIDNIMSVLIFSNNGSLIKSIYNLNGKHIRLNLSQLNNGIYTIIVKTNSNTYINKFLKNN